MKEDSVNTESKAAPQKGAASAVERLVKCPYCAAIPYPHNGYAEVLHKRGCFLSQPMAVRDPMPIYRKDFIRWNNRAI